MCPSFDAAAETYDREFEALPATARIRHIVHEVALRFFPAGGSILELNCGTGTDAIALAQHGFQILATDASPAMIRVARKKLSQLPTHQIVEFRVMPFDEVPRLGGMKFDGVFSNMGGLNCIPDLRPVAEALAGAVKPKGHVIATFLSDFCLWESIAFLLRLDVGRAFRRRLRRGNRVSLHGSSVEVYFHSPSSVKDAFSPYFNRSLLLGLNIFTPPPSSVRAYQRLSHATWPLESLDNVLSTIPPFNRVGDHFVIALQRL